MSEIEGFAGRFFSLRSAANKSQEEVAVALGLTKSSVSSFERGKSIPSPDNLVKLATLFNVSVDYLLTGRDTWVRAERGKNRPLPKDPAVVSTNDSFESPKPIPAIQNLTDEPTEQLSNTEERTELIEYLLSNINFKALKLVQYKVPEVQQREIENDRAIQLPTDIPVFDQVQVDKRFLTELDRLLKSNIFPTYTAWAHAVNVGPNYVAAIEKGRYHFNIELLYNTVRNFPDFDFIYVVFGSAWSKRPEPTEFPKRVRGPRTKMDSSFHDRLRSIILENALDITGMVPGDHIDLANDKAVYKLYTDEYGPIKDNNKYLHEIALIIEALIDEIKNGFDKE